MVDGRDIFGELGGTQSEDLENRRKIKGQRNAGGEIEKTTDIKKCPQCGANLIYEPKIEMLYCEHCETRINIEKDFNVTAKDFNLAECDTEDWRDEAVVYVCNNCGVKEVLSKFDLSKVCAYCGSSNILETEELPGIKPGCVIPFTVGKRECVLSVKKWLKMKFFVPTAFKKQTKEINTNGTYSPVWAFDTQTVSTYNGVLGKTYVVTVGSGKNMRTETRIRYFNVSGNFAKSFNYLPIEACPNLTQKVFNELRPFDVKSAVVYDKKYLAGFSANHYDKDIKVAFIEAKTIMDADIRKNILKKYNADIVQYLNVSTSYNNIKYKYTLFPIWIGHNEFKQKRYNFFVNGNSAKVTGKVPRSGWKIFRFISILGAVVAGIATVCVLLL